MQVRLIHLKPPFCLVTSFVTLQHSLLFFQSSLFEIISSNKIFVRSSEIFARSTKMYTEYVEFSIKTNRGPKIFATMPTSTRWSVGLTNPTTQNSHALLVNNPHTNHWLRQYHPKKKDFFLSKNTICPFC